MLCFNVVPFGVSSSGQGPSRRRHAYAMCYLGRHSCLGLGWLPGCSPFASTTGTTGARQTDPEFEGPSVCLAARCFECAVRLFVLPVVCPRFVRLWIPSTFSTSPTRSAKQTRTYTGSPNMHKHTT